MLQKARKDILNIIQMKRGIQYKPSDETLSLLMIKRLNLAKLDA